MGKHLKLFNLNNEYTSFLEGDEFVTPNVSYIIENDIVYYNPLIEISGHEVGDICCANANGDKKFIKVGESIPDGYEPIGVVVIPSSHDVYGTGECAVMSLKYMDYTTPDEGSVSANTMRWGGKDNISLYGYSKAAAIGSANAQTETVSFNEMPYLPSDAFTGPTCTKDTNAFYNASYSSSSYIVAPSPYLTDGSRNSQYYTTGNNALSDFDGVGNTNVITGLATGQSDWKTAISISNVYENGYYPAACCCWRYHTVGTNQGDWYLPACGELGYLCARFKTINNAIQYLIDSGFSDSCSLAGGCVFWSSSMKDINFNMPRVIRTDRGTVCDAMNLGNNYVRAFLRV